MFKYMITFKRIYFTVVFYIAHEKFYNRLYAASNNSDLLP